MIVAAYLDFSGKQTRELLGERDLSMTEVTAVIAGGIGKPNLRYEQFSSDQVQQVLTQKGDSAEGSRVVHRDIQGRQRRSPRSARAAFDGEHHTDFV